MTEMEKIRAAADKVLSVCGKAEIGVILGSGLGDYANALEDAVCLPYSEIPCFPRSTVAGHAGRLCCGMLHGKRVVMMQGRFHYYEGYSMKEITLPVRVMQLMGVKTLIVTNACGGGAFNIFLIRQFVSSIPRELDQAAEIDGAGPMRVLTSILLPSIRPAIIVVALFLFIQIWNDLLQQTIYIDDPAKYTISIGLSMFRGALKADWAAIMCGAVLSFIPGLIIFLFGQRYFVEGIVMTGMKN